MKRDGPNGTSGEAKNDAATRNFLWFFKLERESRYAQNELWRSDFLWL